MSPVTLWEILVTGDFYQREDLIYFSQHLFYHKLLKSPAEFIINYINNGCPIEEKYFDIHSTSVFSEVWEDLVADKKKTFVTDRDEIKKVMKSFQKNAGMLREILTKESVRYSYDYKLVSTQIFYELRVKNLKVVKEDKYITSKSKKIYKASLFFILMILCAENIFDNEPIINFWKKIGITNIIERFNFIIKNYEVLVHRGPFLVMSLMAMNQYQVKASRGLFMDCLHSIYLPYVDVLMTNDLHFKSLKDRVEEAYPIFQKVFYVSDGKLTFNNHL